MKRLIAALLAGLTLFALVGCSAGSKADSAAPKDYSQILHDARTDEENEYDMIFTKGEDGKFTAIDGYSAEYEAGQLDDEVRSILLPLLNLEDDMYTDLAASISAMMVRSYAVAIVKPAEGKTDAVKSALEAYVTSEQQSMEHYLEDQYQIAKAATVTVAPTGEVILVCAENHDTLLDNIDGTGNRVASTIFGHEEVYFIVGVNKLAPDYDAALWRARNVASPKNARRLGKKTPCAVRGDKCYDCKSPERICRALVVLWERPTGIGRAEVVLVNEPLGY